MVRLGHIRLLGRSCLPRSNCCFHARVYWFLYQQKPYPFFRGKDYKMCKTILKDCFLMLQSSHCKFLLYISPK